MRESNHVYYATAKTDRDALNLAWTNLEEPHRLFFMTHLGDVSQNPDDLPREALERFGRFFRVRVGIKTGPRGFPEPVSEVEELPMPERRAWSRTP